MFNGSIRWGPVSSNSAVLLKHTDRLLIVTELCEDLFRMGAENSGGVAGCGSPLAKRNPDRTTVISLSTPGTGPNCLVRSRSIVCGCCKTWGIDKTSPDGTPWLLNSDDHSLADLAASASSISRLSSKRRFFRSSRSLKRGSLASSLRPISSQSFWNCSCDWRRC